MPSEYEFLRAQVDDSIRRADKSEDMRERCIEVVKLFMPPIPNEEDGLTQTLTAIIAEINRIKPASVPAVPVGEDRYRAGMLHAARLCKNEFNHAPEAAKDHDSTWMGGYESACDHLSVLIERAAVIDCVRIATPVPVGEEVDTAKAACLKLTEIDWIIGYELTEANMHILDAALGLAWKAIGGDVATPAPKPAGKQLDTCVYHCESCAGMDHHWMSECDEDTNNGEPFMTCRHCDASRDMRDDEELD